jgi:hypothetical protein
MKAHIMGALCAGLFSLGLVSTANAALFPVTAGPLAGLAVYNNVLDITWSVNADGNGSQTWDTQRTWAAGLTTGGFLDWRLPSADVNGDNVVIHCDGGGIVGCADNELGYLFWEEGITFDTPGPFANLLASTYWTDTESSSEPTTEAWRFFFTEDGLEGRTIIVSKDFLNKAWAVHEGNPGNAVVPVPAAVWLFGSALGLLGWMRRRKTA